MDTYHINLSRTTFGDQTLWSGSVMKMAKPIPGQRNTISMAETIARTSKAVAEGDIIRESTNLDFANNEVLFIPTFERLTSLEDLKIKLQEIEE